MTDFGLIGHPVGHSMSKVMHEAAFRHLDLEYTYGLFDVEEEELRLFMDNANFLGLNVTIPLKTAVAGYMDELSREASLIGAVNTVEFKDKRKVGYNTDSIGFARSLHEAGIDINDQTFLVLGTGGAARGIAFKLAMEKARVYLYGRNTEKLKSLSEDVLDKVGVRVEPVGSIGDVIRKVDVLVNATSMGMYPNINESPVPSDLLYPLLKVVDVVYNPLETKLLADARALGCDTVDGAGMLVHQGAESLRIWLGIEPPIEVMRQAVLDSLRTRA